MNFRNDKFVESGASNIGINNHKFYIKYSIYFCNKFTGDHYTYNIDFNSTKLNKSISNKS